MSHDDVLAVLADFAGPLGPLQTPEERDARKQQWMDTVEISAVDRLLAVLDRSRQAPELERLDKDHVEFELAELLSGHPAEPTASPSSPKVLVRGPSTE